jgi:putative FmdB family regulatory protein
MPIYAYRCQHCGHELEALQKMSDEPLVQCPECDRPALKKQLTAAAFRLSGSGWYETDFKKGNKRNLAGDEAAAKPGTGDKADGGDKKADKKAESKPDKPAASSSS